MALSDAEIIKLRQKYNVKFKKPRASDDVEDEIKRLEAVAQEGRQGRVGVEQPQKKGILEKISSASEATFGKASEFLFGTTGKVAGTVVGTAAESVKKALTGKGFGKEGEDVFKPQEVITPKNILFTGLELIPDVKPVLGAIRAIPKYGEKIAVGITRGIDSLVEKIPESLRESAIQDFYKILNPTTKPLKRLTQKVAPEMAEKVGVITSTEKLLGKASEKVSIMGEKIQESLLDILPEQSTKIMPILESLSKFQKKFMVDGISAEPKVTNAVNDIASSLIDLTKQGDEISTQGLVRLNQIWSKTVAKASGFERFSDEISQAGLLAKKEATRIIREQLAKDLPDVAILNKEFTFWKRVEDIVRATVERRTGQAVPLSERFGQVVGGVAGTGGGPTKIVIGAYLGKKIIQAIRSPLWKSIAAKTKDQIADLIAEGRLSQAESLLEQLVVRGQNLIQKEE